MVKATRATLKRLETEDFGDYTRVATLLEYIVKAADRYEKTGDYNRLYRAVYLPDCLHYMAYTDEKPFFAGLSTRFPSLVDCTFTAGNNECRILDINKLVKAILEIQ